MSEPDKTLGEFLAQKRICKAAYYDLKKRGLGPEVITYPGTRIIRISAAAEAAWDARMRELAESESAKLEAERRRESAIIAGQISAASPLHVSRRGARSASAPRRGPQRRRGR
jgi:hypothetical protein